MEHEILLRKLWIGSSIISFTTSDNLQLLHSNHPLWNKLRFRKTSQIHSDRSQPNEEAVLSSQHCQRRLISQSVSPNIVFRSKQINRRHLNSSPAGASKSVPNKGWKSFYGTVKKLTTELLRTGKFHFLFLLSYSIKREIVSHKPSKWKRNQSYGGFIFFIPSERKF